MSLHTLQRILEGHLGQVASQGGFPHYQLKALGKLSVCRTATLGGHAQYCENNHLNGVWYNSCKQRYCPQCRGMATEEWLKNTQRVLLDCPHHHIVFTIPSELNVLWRYNRSKMRGLLFRAVQDTLKTFASDSKYLKAMPGILCTLHTWGRNLSLHPHIHALVSHGGINAKGEWIVPKRDILFPQKPVMQVFRGKLRGYLLNAIKESTWRHPPPLTQTLTQNLLNKLGRKSWVVHFSQRYDYAEGVAKYLSRYVKSGPLKNTQLSEVTETHISFRYKSHQTKQVETLTLTIADFIRRLSQHLPDPGKPSVRYSGLYNSAARKKLNIARNTLGQSEVSERVLVKWQAYLEERWVLPRCAICGKPLTKQASVLPTRQVG